MLPYELIEKKQHGNELTREEIQYFVQGFTAGNIPDYQMSAFLMAVYFQGFSDAETATLVDTMLHSGATIDLQDVAGYKVDKHSTGGVGDKVSLILAPLVAAAGVKVPMISGRGLGHTGGTLDKLEAIPGFNTEYNLQEFRQQVDDIDVCIMSQNDNIVPADKKMYALRDVTSTVRSIPLICASIMSKKIAEGIDGLVLDVKTGRGAFIPEYEQTKTLAERLVAIGKKFDLDITAVITDMNQPLGNRIGNWSEVVESVEALQGKGPDDLMEVTLELCAHMITMAGKADSISAAKHTLNTLIDSGKALDKFYEFVEAQKGDVSAVQNLQNYPKSTYSRGVKASHDGIIQSIDSYRLGITSVSLGAGRQQMDDLIDPKAGITLYKKIGDSVESGEVVAEFYTDKESVLNNAEEQIQSTFEIGEEPVEPPKLIHEVIG